MDENRGYQGKRLQPKKRAAKFWSDYGYLLVTVAVVFVLFKVVFQLAYVPTGSMETTVPSKSLMVCWRLPYVVSDPVPERGEVVTFWSDEMGKLLVKRVIGLPGDEISFSGGYVYINGERLEEDYLPQQGIRKCCQLVQCRRVGANEAIVRLLGRDGRRRGDGEPKPHRGHVPRPEPESLRTVYGAVHDRGHRRRYRPD